MGLLKVGRCISPKAIHKRTQFFKINFFKINVLFEITQKRAVKALFSLSFLKKRKLGFIEKVNKKRF